MACAEPGSAHDGECVQPSTATEAIVRFNRVLHTVAQHFPGRVSVISIADLVCPDGTCVPIRDGMLIRYDGQHYTSASSRWLGPQLLTRVTCHGASSRVFSRLALWSLAHAFLDGPSVSANPMTPTSFSSG